ncbi:MAG: ribonuclease J [Oscillospiraceae bacterium]|nr:ribonuclease J [Oscillospiraceae bacterium]
MDQKNKEKDAASAVKRQETNASAPKGGKNLKEGQTPQKRKGQRPALPKGPVNKGAQQEARPKQRTQPKKTLPAATMDALYNAPVLELFGSIPPVEKKPEAEKPPRQPAAQRQRTQQKGAAPRPQPQQRRRPPQALPVQQGRPQAKPGRRGGKEAINIIPLGGLGEVGKNITVFECRGDMLIVDCGLVFPDSDMFGVDLVIPDFTFVIEHKNQIKGVFITHGHEDHIGALPYLLKQVKLPVYGTRLTLGLITNKLKEHNLDTVTDLRQIEAGQQYKAGCMTVEPIRVNHSIPDAVGFAIASPAGTVVTTGDFKVDYTPVFGKPIDLARFGEYGKEGVLALLSDSTNAERPGFTKSERHVGENMETLFDRADHQRILIATFASNIQRVQQILDLAVKHGRKVAVSGRSMINNTEMALELGYLKAPQNLIIDIEECNKYPPEKVVIVTTGSQGEPLSALTRMSSGMHRNVHIGAGDFIIISANPIPGNEKMVGKVINGLLKLGAEVIYESMYEVHTSGHACNEEQKLIMDLVHPQYFLPVHGEYKQLKKHALLAESMGIPEKNIHIGEIGQIISISRDGITVTGQATAGQVFVDGLGVGDVGSVVLRDRKHLSEDGLVIIVATVDSATGELLSGPDIVSRGFVYVRESEELMEQAKKQVREALEKCVDEGVHDWSGVKTRVRDQVSQLLYRRTKRSPMILPILMEV